MGKTVCLLILFATTATVAIPQSLVNLEVESWVYPVLERFVSKGCISVDTEARPLTRGQAAEALKGLIEQVEKEEISLSSVDEYYVARLKTEFAQELGLRYETRNQDIPFIIYSDGDNRLDFDVDLEERVTISRDRAKDDSVSLDTLQAVTTTSLGLESYGELKGRVCYDERLVFSLIEGDEDMSSAHSGEGLRPWKRGTAEIERAYFKYKIGVVGIELGRDRFWWGPAKFGTLLVSSGGEPLDVIGLDGRLGIVSARAFSAVLSSTEGIYLSAHRLSLNLPLRTVFGVSEAVLYHRDFFPEPQYLNPIIPYYAAEHNLKKDDNTLWNFDVMTCPGAGLRLYGEFIIDDFQYERSADAPDKLGGLAGVYASDPLGMPDSDIRCEYTRLNKWVYTHRYSYNKYVHSGMPIGEILGPDSDRLILEVCHRPSKVSEVFLRYMYLRHGEGTLDLPWEEEGGDPRPPFPSGKVETTNGLFADVSLRPAWWFYVKAGIGYTRARNRTAFGITPEKPVDSCQWDIALDIDI
jgi:hypothetical protein